jgi:hypothetical protein
VEARFFAPVQNGPGAHPASSTMGTGFFPGQNDRGVALTTHPQLAPRFLFIYFNCILVDTRWQQYSTHLHTNSTQNIENGTYIKKIGKCGPCPVFASYTLAFALQLRKKHGETPVRVVEKCPGMPLAAVQYTVTHKQYTELHFETEHTEQNIHNNKNT